MNEVSDGPGDRQSGQPDDGEGVSPVEACGEPRAEEQAKCRSDRDAQREDRQRPRTAFGRDPIGDQRIARRDPAGLADSDSHAQQKQLPEILAQPRQGGEQAPHRDRRRHHADASGPVGQPRKRDGEGRIDRRECDSAHQPELGVSQAKFGLDRDLEDRDQLAVEEIEDVGEEQQPDQWTGAPAPRLGFVRRCQNLYPTVRNSWRGLP